MYIVGLRDNGAHLLIFGVVILCKTLNKVYLVSEEASSHLPPPPKPSLLFLPISTRWYALVVLSWTKKKNPFFVRNKTISLVSVCYIAAIVLDAQNTSSKLLSVTYI